jgi:hypothetical protein
MDDFDANTTSDAHSSTIDECKFDYNPVNYDTYNLPSEWNQSTIESMNQCRNDINPSVQFDHLLRAAISSSVKGNAAIENTDRSYLKYVDGNISKHEIIEYEEDETCMNLGKRFKPKFMQMCSEMDSAVFEITEAPIEKPDAGGIIKKGIQIIRGDFNHDYTKIPSNSHFSITTVPQLKNQNLLKISGNRKKFSIASLFGSNQGLKDLDAGCKSIDNLNGFNQIMDSCLALHQERVVGNIQESVKKKGIRFSIHTSHEERTINEINEKLVAGGLPDLKSCMLTQREVLKRKKKRELIKEKIAGLMYTFIVFGALLSLGTFLTLRMLNEFTSVEIISSIKSKSIIHQDEATVKIDCHTYLGSKTGDVISFRGIPYVDTPVKRWKKHSKNTCSNNEKHKIINATEYGDMCMQTSDDKKTVVGSEDCLFLNIWTRSLTSRLPVVVFIHEGEFLTGSGNLGSKYDLYNFIAEKIVLISFNYRLNIFGFFVTGSHTNFGLDDQLVALSWIQENVQYFGGDPDRVTLFGEGTGALSSLALSLSERSSDLFQSIWISHLPDKALEFKTISFNTAKLKNREYFFSKFNCTNYNCLRALDSKELCKSYENFAGYDLESNFIIDSNVFNQATEKFFAEARAKTISADFLTHPFLLAKISIIIGTSFSRPFNLNFTNTAKLCYLYRLFNRLSLQPQVSLFHYNLEFNETIFKYLDEKSDEQSIDTIAIFDRYDKFEKYGEVAVEFQKGIRSQFIYLVNGDTSKFSWAKYPNDSIILKPGLAKSNNFFENVCEL